MVFKKGMIPHNKGLKNKDWEKKPRWEKVCSSCGLRFEMNREYQIYCNQKCYAKLGKLKEEGRNSRLIKGNSENKYHLGHLKEDVGYKALHEWIRNYKKKTGKCEICGSTKSGSKDGRDLDLANISGEYKRDVEDFAWLCIKCHRRFDTIKKKNPYEVIGIEVKMTGELDRQEKEKCIWLLENKIFSKILVARKTKVKNKIVVEYEDFKEIEKRMRG